MTRFRPPLSDFGVAEFEQPSTDMTVGRRSALLALGALGAATIVGASAAPASAAPTNTQNPVTGWFHATEYGADPTGAADAGPAINAAIAAAKSSPLSGGVVYIGPGTYKISTTINMSNIHPEYAVPTGGTVRLMGAGRYQTRLVGGESGYGFIEMIGSNRCAIEGMSLIQTTSGLKTGILLGRTGNASSAPSSGEHYLHDLVVHGHFGVAGIFALASEQTSYDEILIYTLAGRGMVLARDIAGWTTAEFPGFQAKYTPMCTWDAMGSGNGVIRLSGLNILTYHDDDLAGPLTWEYAQSGQADRLYTWSRRQTHITLAKSAHNISFRNCHQEWDWLRPNEPVGFHLKKMPNKPAWDGHNYRFSIENSRVLAIYGDQGQTLGDFTFRSSEWTGLSTLYQIDVDKAYGLDVHYDTRMGAIASAGNEPGLDGIQRTVKYRARTAGGGSRIWPNTFSTADRPSPNDLGDDWQVYDTTLKKPLWARGGQWLDVNGTPV